MREASSTDVAWRHSPSGATSEVLSDGKAWLIVGTDLWIRDLGECVHYTTLVLHRIVLGFSRSLMALLIYKRSLEGSKDNIWRSEGLGLRTSVGRQIADVTTRNKPTASAPSNTSLPRPRPTRNENGCGARAKNSLFLTARRCSSSHKSNLFHRRHRSTNV